MLLFFERIALVETTTFMFYEDLFGNIHSWK